MMDSMHGLATKEAAGRVKEEEYRRRRYSR